LSLHAACTGASIVEAASPLVALASGASEEGDAQLAKRTTAQIRNIAARSRKHRTTHASRIFRRLRPNGVNRVHTWTDPIGSRRAQLGPRHRRRLVEELGADASNANQSRFLHTSYGGGLAYGFCRLVLHGRRRTTRTVTTEVPWSSRRPAPRAVLYAIGISAALTALCILTIDQPLARVLGGYEQSAFWNDAIGWLEWALGLPFFKFFSSVLLVAVMLALMAVPRWRVYAPAWIVVAGTHVICRFLTVRIKDATGRLRPNEWLAKGGDDTFFRDGVAFPSGHVALFASIVIPLAIVVPRTRPLLAIVAFVMFARIIVNGHWVSDTTGSITLVVLVAWLLSLLVRPFRTG
jgi:membrane-associated phospholipid phosphatase